MPNSRFEKYVECDECHQETKLILDSPSLTKYGIFEWRFPWKWFVFKDTENKGFCSWRCTKDFVDRMYAKNPD